MKPNTLNKFITATRANWQGLTSTNILNCKTQLEELARTPSSEPWLAQLHASKQSSTELYRDPEHGFILLAHIEPKHTYRPPHNHGAGWVLYAVQHGAMDISTYSQVTDCNGHTQLVSRGATTLSSGQCHVYLPKDIHDTKSTTDYVLMFRLTSTDIQTEKREGRLIQFDLSR
ncbi:hypothetical protein PSECIP111951_00895 [Pseudoalteromonas holothuriae]|uniref:Cysteine dioxygenase n=1 Tax=Pseudoalteromonas holothuriae TaxID=2963714 RepID=A0A9W4QW53_9GAMM|nr:MULTISPECIES: hypothetical protein [unclassified Pseudoalteromonas]CAH9053794.1 hypothetical protein PSECIP111951_00895 [Pseudoalteromonas sp. CIP111951]CAH9055817.1 hypothetical protein PSECIP111854_01655 [Pseudoalteromonas sp. CIP111854]